jgi:dTDP-4-amino-4,6-dideoxygalactose transaminase
MTRRQTIPITRPWLDEREVEAARRSILSGWVTQGPEVAAFEYEFADSIGAKHACAVSSCTTALHLALLAVGVRPGDEVITVSHSFIATANAVRYCGAVPLFVDIQPATYNIDPELIERLITDRTRAILCVHQMGMPCDLRGILQVARRRSLVVVEDAACAAGSEIFWDGSWQKIGKPHGDIACFSFHPRKAITTGDGGMITTSNDDWDAHLRLLRQHGMDVPDTSRHAAKDVIFESYPILGYNYRMTDIQAALGREQLKRLKEITERRRFLAQRYQQLFAECEEIELPYEPDWARSNWQSFCVRLPERCGQRQVMQKMREDAYAKEEWRCSPSPNRCECAPRTCACLRVSEEAQDHTIILPLFHQMTVEEQDLVVGALRRACT